MHSAQHFTTVILLSCIFSQGAYVNLQEFASVPNASLQIKRQLFGVNLRPVGIKLLTNIEIRCGISVREEYKKDLDRIAEAEISSDGTPIVRANPEKEITEEIIIHELFHLKMRIESFPTIWFEGPRNVMTANAALLNLLRLYVYDTIEHWIYYPQLREMGYKPDALRKAEMKEVISKNRFINEPLSDIDLAVRYFRCALEVDDPELLSRFAKYYESRQWSVPLQTGRKLAQIVQELKPYTSEKEVEAFLRCISLLLGTKIKFEFNRWETETLGRIERHYAVVWVLPTN